MDIYVIEDVPKGDIWFNPSQQIHGSFVNSDKSSIMKLSQPKKTKDSYNTRIKFIDTSDSNYEGNFSFSSYMYLTSKFSFSTSIDFFSYCISIGILILLNAF